METMCTRKSLKNGDIKTEKEEQAKRSDHTKHSSSVTTTGLDTKGSFQAETIVVQILSLVLSLKETLLITPLAEMEFRVRIGDGRKGTFNSTFRTTI
ncbi:unnamed protein product, partial [Allacma fusca]